MATISDARRKANKKWNDANLKDRYDRISLVVPRGRKDVIQAAADKAEQSLNGYVAQAVSERLEREESPWGEEP